MKKFFENLPKYLFYFSVFVFVYAYGVNSHKHNLFPYKQVQHAIDSLKLTQRELDNITKSNPIYFLQPARYEGSGVTVNKLDAGNSDLIFMAGFFDQDNGLRLIKRNGDVVAQWKVRYSDLFPNPTFLTKPPTTDWNVDLHGALILPDGSVVFNFEYAGMVKLDHCGKVVWTLPMITHHSLERSEQGGYWVPGRLEYPAGTESKFPPYDTPYKEDFIYRISEDGKVEKKISLPGLFYRSGLQSLFTASGELYFKKMNWDHELAHLNKVAELSSRMAKAFPMFKAGDLLLSLRTRNMILVVDPESETIKWWHIGPWIRQHDPNFQSDGTITVFNNNIYTVALHKDGTSDLTTPPVSNIIDFNPQTGKSTVIYGGKPDQPLLSVIRGRQETTPDGGLMIAEFEGGRALETNTSGQIVWQYINRYDKDHVAELTEAKLYPYSYFTQSDWSCEKH